MTTNPTRHPDSTCPAWCQPGAAGVVIAPRGALSDDLYDVTIGRVTKVQTAVQYAGRTRAFRPSSGDELREVGHRASSAWTTAARLLPADHPDVGPLRRRLAIDAGIGNGRRHADAAAKAVQTGGGSPRDEALALDEIERAIACLTEARRALLNLRPGGGQYVAEAHDCTSCGATIDACDELLDQRRSPCCGSCRVNDTHGDPVGGYSARAAARRARAALAGNEARARAGGVADGGRPVSDLHRWLVVNRDDDSYVAGPYTQDGATSTRSRLEHVMDEDDDRNLWVIDLGVQEPEIQLRLAREARAAGARLPTFMARWIAEADATV